MTLEETRAAIASAATDAGFNGHPYLPRTLVAGSVWPALSSLDFTSPAVDSSLWSVLWALGADSVKASRELDARLTTLRAALESVGVLPIRAGVITLESNGGEILAVDIECRAALSTL